MSSSTWPGRPMARLIGRILALIAAILAVLICSDVRGQTARVPHPPVARPLRAR